MHEARPAQPVKVVRRSLRPALRRRAGRVEIAEQRIQDCLGGNCVRYTASTCSNGLTADAMPQACGGIEEKLSCKLRDDGLKDCCCITYDKF